MKSQKTLALALAVLVITVVPAAAQAGAAEAGAAPAAPAQDAAAQAGADRGRPYAGFGAIADGEWYPSNNYVHINPLRSSVGVSATVGTFLTPRVMVELEIDMPGELAQRDVTNSGQGRTDDRAQSKRMLTESVLVGFRTRPRARTGFTFWSGASFFRLKSAQTIVVTFGSPPTSTTNYYENVDHSTGVVVGLDANVAISRHLSLVPFVRTYAVASILNRGMILRSGASLRWQF